MEQPGLEKMYFSWEDSYISHYGKNKTKHLKQKMMI